ncbi:hypothetical protein PybrP1_001143 [[Pythium] brassicae (nom. inval.)]|nr:hypothetical protein PybrP1_001143 [[Pythium] brassicae (nom. inval.)]
MGPKRKRDEDVDAAASDDLRAAAARQRVDAGAAGTALLSSDLSVPSLRYATESWQGMKPSNEDRHVADLTRFPGPVFGVFDGHGGVFAVEFLVRHLLKTLSVSIRQHVPAREADALVALRTASAAETQRRRELERQLALCRTQLEEMQQLRADASERDSDSANAASREPSAADAVCEQLRATIRAIEAAVAQIAAEQAQRRARFTDWVLRQDAALKRALLEGFQRTDAQVVQKNPSRDGSTALLLWFVVGDRSDPADAAYYYTANLGDCRAVLCRGSHAVPLTTDHTPGRPDERQRIVAAGGFVGTFAGVARVYSAAGAGLSVRAPAARSSEAATFLAVSRAFGDRPLKVPTPLVSCEPEVKRFRVERDDLFVVAACDGVWDVLSNQDAVNIGLQHFASAQRAADAIVKEAYRRGSSDNLTATVVQFGWQDGSALLAHAQTQAMQAQAATQKSRSHGPPAMPRFAALKALGRPTHPRAASLVDAEASEAAASAAGETTENQDDEDDEDDDGENDDAAAAAEDADEEIDMFNL